MGFDPLSLIPMAGDAISGVINANQARKAFKSRYQDTVADMKKAGLNPALAYGQGGGNPQTTPIPELGTSYARGQQQLGSAKQSEKQAELLDAQIQLLKAQSLELSRRPYLENLKLQADTSQSNAQTGNIFTASELNRARTSGQNIENIGLQTRNDILAIDQALKELQRGYEQRTLEDRVRLVETSLQQAGRNVTATDIANILANLKRPQAETTAEGFNALQSFKKWWGNQNEREAQELRDASDAVKNWVNKAKRSVQHGKTQGTEWLRKHHLGQGQAKRGAGGRF